MSKCLNTHHSFTPAPMFCTSEGYRDVLGGVDAHDANRNLIAHSAYVHVCGARMCGLCTSSPGFEVKVRVRVKVMGQ